VEIFESLTLRRSIIGTVRKPSASDATRSVPCGRLDRLDHCGKLRFDLLYVCRRVSELFGEILQFLSPFPRKRGTGWKRVSGALGKDSFRCDPSPRGVEGCVRSSGWCQYSSMVELNGQMKAGCQPNAI
jgi:hypothetical protein